MIKYDTEKIGPLLEACSLLVMFPKEPFFEWLNILESKGMACGYHEREDAAWVIPNILFFEDESHFDLYIRNYKPHLLEQEFLRYVNSSSDYPEDISLEAFDRYFDIKVRDVVGSLPVDIPDAQD